MNYFVWNQYTFADLQDQNIVENIRTQNHLHGCVYIWVDRRSNLIWYVGQSSQVITRLRTHTELQFGGRYRVFENAACIYQDEQYALQNGLIFSPTAAHNHGDLRFVVYENIAQLTDASISIFNNTDFLIGTFLESEDNEPNYRTIREVLETEIQNQAYELAGQQSLAYQEGIIGRGLVNYDPSEYEFEHDTRNIKAEYVELIP